jgi:hypothetical protein
MAYGVWLMQEQRNGSPLRPGSKSFRKADSGNAVEWRQNGEEVVQVQVQVQVLVLVLDHWCW